MSPEPKRDAAEDGDGGDRAEERPGSGTPGAPSREPVREARSPFLEVFGLAEPELAAMSIEGRRTLSGLPGRLQERIGELRHVVEAVFGILREAAHRDRPEGPEPPRLRRDELDGDGRREHVLRQN